MALLIGITTSFGYSSNEWHWTLYVDGYLGGGQACESDSSHKVCGLAIGY